jgi:haloacetate dehalogenase
MIKDFSAERIAVGESELFVRTGGSGPPLLLLHGYPQTGAMWHAVAPKLAGHFSLVIPDLPGYGKSNGPPCDAAFEAYAKRTNARTMADLMTHLGHERFYLAGHDRGGRVAFRLCLDHPGRVERYAALDIIPTLDQWEALNADKALAGYHWQFLAVPAPVPEKLIGSDPDFYLEHLLRRWAGNFEALTEGSLSDYREAFRKPDVIHATCNDYRAGASVDRVHDQASRDAGEKIVCPVLVVMGSDYLSRNTGTPELIWRRWSDDVRTVALKCGHFVAEEKPDDCAAALIEFFT